MAASSSLVLAVILVLSLLSPFTASLTVDAATPVRRACHYSNGFESIFNAWISSFNGGFLLPSPTALISPTGLPALGRLNFYPDITYQQDIHICASQACPVTVSGIQRDIAGTNYGGWFFPSSAVAGYSTAYSAFSAVPATTYTLYASNNITSSQTCSAKPSNISLCCVYNSIYSNSIGTAGGYTKFSRGYTGQFVTRIEHPNRPGGCNQYFSQGVTYDYALATQYNVSSAADCVVQQEPVFQYMVQTFA